MNSFSTPLCPTQAGLDLVGSIALAVSINLVLHSVTPAYAGPLTAMTMLIVVSTLLRRRGQRWSDLGLVRRQAPLAMLGLVLLVMVGSILAGGVTSGICASLMEASPASRVARFGEVQGNLPKFLALVAMGWAVGGFIEEMVFRGFFLHRFETLFAACTGRAGLATALASRRAGHTLRCRALLQPRTCRRAHHHCRRYHTRRILPAGQAVAVADHPGPRTDRHPRLP